MCGQAQHINHKIIDDIDKGDSLYNLERYSSALIYYNASINGLKKAYYDDTTIFDTHKEEIIHIYSNIGDCEFATGMYSKAIHDFEYVMNFCLDHGSLNIESYRISQGDCYLKLGNYEKALDLYNTAFDMLNQDKTSLEYKLEAYMVLDKMGDIYHKQGNDAKAQLYYNESIKLKTK